MGPARQERADEFAAFVALYGDTLLRRAVMLTGTFTAAEDLTQTTLLRCWLHWSKLRAANAAFPYARTVMIRQAVRGRGRRWTGESPTADPPERLDPDRGYSQVDDNDALRRLLATLTPNQRAVLVLRFLDDLSEEATAETLGCSVGTVKSRTSRALTALRAAGVLTDDRTVL